MVGYKNVLYDKKNNQILVRRVGETKYEKIDYKNFYYIETNEVTDLKDCFGRNMKLVEGGSADTLKRFKQSGVKIAESDFDPVVKWLHKEYDFVELNHNAKDFRICYFDIEVQSARKYPLNHKIKFKRIDGEPIKTVKGRVEFAEDSVRNFEDHYHGPKNYLVFDEETNKWSKYRGSCYYNPSDFPTPEEAKYPINLISCISSVDGKIYTWGLEPYTDTEHPIDNYRWFTDELDMFKDWLKWFHQQEFDIWSGWNSDLYDIPYICNRLHNIAEERGIDKDFTCYLSPLLKKAIKKEKRAPKTNEVLGTTFDIPGLLCIDFMDAFKKFGPYANLPSWKLAYVADITVGRTKLEHDELPFDVFYRKDYNFYVRYNRVDAELLPAMDAKQHIMDMVISFAHDCLIPLGKVFSMLNTVVGYILKFIHEKHIVMNDKPETKPRDWWFEEGLWRVKQPDGNIYLQNVNWEKGETTFKPYAVKAGYVFAAPGRYRFNMSGDITSSYPHQIMMYYISPETKVIHPTKEQIESGEVIQSEVNGVGYRRSEDAILPSVVRKVFGEKDYYSKLKKEALKKGDTAQAVVYECLRSNKKIIANSVYGVCLNEHFPFYDIDNARAITRGGRVCIRYIMEQTNRYYRHKQFLIDGMKEMPVINIRYNGENHWLAKNDEVEVKDKRTGEIKVIKVESITEDYLINPESVDAHKIEVK